MKETVEYLVFQISRNQPATWEYLGKHPIYSRVFEKITKDSGITRKMIIDPLNKKEAPIDLSQWDEDILEKMKLLPSHVKDVIGLEEEIDK